MKRLSLKWLYISILCFVFGFAPLAKSWDVHQLLMDPIIDSSPAPLRAALDKTYPLPCGSEDQVFLKALIESLKLSSKTTLPSLGQCGARPISADQLLRGELVDEPDYGMDLDLPASFDPKGARKWMGGTQGPSSQGYRHMYFGGWNPLSPIATLQFPLTAMGEAPERAQIIGAKAKEYRKKGWGLWSIRLLGWALHYIQDLSQPYHSVQLVTPRIVPWLELFSWPPTDIMSRLIQQTTRTVANYHWIYEGYTKTRLRESPSPFEDCLRKPSFFATVSLDLAQNPEDIASLLATASSKLAAEVGAAELAFFGNQYLGQEWNISQGKGTVDYQNYAIRPDKAAERLRLHEVTCKGLANATLSSQKLMEWVLLSP